MEKLTKREKEVAKCVAEGMNNIQIKEFLKISMPTVKSHLDHIYGKYGLLNARINNGEFGFMRVKVALQYLKDEGKLTMKYVNKYHKTLQEIKKILLQAMDVKSDAYNHFSKVEQAIDLIIKAEEE